uniref:Uncharacterized protein n=1 Tax=Arundo donax TaxID=35708 RepID=A0A0A9GHB0_ARUDO
MHGGLSVPLAMHMQVLLVSQNIKYCIGISMQVMNVIVVEGPCNPSRTTSAQHTWLEFSLHGLVHRAGL